jgi:hypothetical protein
MLDSLSRQIVYVPIEVIAGTDSQPFTLTVQSKSGANLTAQAGSGSRVYAKLHGGAAAFQDIATSPLPLTVTGPLAIDFKLHPIASVGRTREMIGIAVVMSSAAVWR